MNWSIQSSEYIVQHHYFTARKDICKMPDGFIVDPYFVVELPASACAFPLTALCEAIMINQYRHLIGKVIREMSGGIVIKGEDASGAMNIELQ